MVAKRKRTTSNNEHLPQRKTVKTATTQPPREVELEEQELRDPLENVDESIRQARLSIQARLCGKVLPLETPGLDDAIEKLSDLANNSIIKSESNSVLLIGPRSSGKTMVIRKALDKFPADKFVTVWLDGTFQTSDQLAVKEIVRQLQMETQIECAKPTNVNECLNFVIDTLNSGSKENIPVVFILEEFDLFALHPKQSLLYTLFDIAQTCVNPVFVIGASQRQDCIELLEKRVKSRFSHRVIFTYPPKNVQEMTQMVRNAITLSPSSSSSSTSSSSKNDSVSPPEITNESYRRVFNERVQQILGSDSFKEIAQGILYGTANIREMYNVFTAQLMSLSASQPYFSMDGFQIACASQLLDPMPDMFNAISPLEQILLVAVKQCVDRHFVPFNFEIVYEYFQEFRRQSDKMAQWLYKKDVVFKAFESLQGMMLIAPINGTGNRCPKMHKMFKVNLSVNDICALVAGSEDCPDDVKKWCMS
ncbi:origin recognition complex subunit 4 C-terminus-domain-containing protein [Obelidium mucronatum]|nr:origin recognition complex subunit 4 C-terminus-domain-containing protein [Obelidium mucronatum]